jgi:acetoacetyl-CoA synthetase
MTSNGKRQEVAVKKILNGARLSQVNADPRALVWFMEHPALKMASAPLKAKL